MDLLFGSAPLGDDDADDPDFKPSDDEEEDEDDDEVDDDTSIGGGSAVLNAAATGSTTDGVARRTRAKHPLTSATLDELELQLPDVDWEFFGIDTNMQQDHTATTAEFGGSLFSPPPPPPPTQESPAPSQPIDEGLDAYQRFKLMLGSDHIDGERMACAHANSYWLHARRFALHPFSSIARWL
jgi:hypothetical protein